MGNQSYSKQRNGIKRARRPKKMLMAGMKCKIAHNQTCAKRGMKCIPEERTQRLAAQNDVSAALSAVAEWRWSRSRWVLVQGTSPAWSRTHIFPTAKRPGWQVSFALLVIGALRRLRWDRGSALAIHMLQRPCCLGKGRLRQPLGWRHPMR